MIFGIGIDLIEIQRVIKACEKEAFLSRIYTKQEQELIRKDKRKAASNFAVKEAVVKAFGTGFYGIAPRQIEVLRDELGKPYVNLYDDAKQFVKDHGIARLFVSVTNTKDLVNAYVIAELKG